MNRRSGLTLLDLLVAMALLVVVLSVVYAVFANHQHTVETASEMRDVYGQGRLILDRLIRDLSGAWLPETAEVGDVKGPAFFGQESRIDFVSSGRLSSEEAAGQDLVEVGYRTEESEDGERLRLIRRQSSVVDADVTEGGGDVELTGHLSSITFTYVDAEGEEQTALSGVQYGQLPAAVRIKVVLFADEERTETFTTMVSLPLAWPLVKPITGVNLGVGF